MLPIALQQREGGQGSDHLTRIEVCERGDPDGHVADELDSGPPRAASDYLTEQRIMDDPDQHLDAWRDGALEKGFRDRIDGYTVAYGGTSYPAKEA